MLGDLEDIVADMLENSIVGKAINTIETVKDYLKETPTWVASTLAGIAKVGYTYGINNINGDNISALIDASKQGAIVFTATQLGGKAVEYLAKNYTNSNAIKRNLYWILPSAVIIPINFAIHYGTGTEAPFWSAFPALFTPFACYGWGNKTRAQYNIPKPEN